MYCLNCGAKIKEEGNVCSICGYNPNSESKKITKKYYSSVHNDEKPEEVRYENISRDEIGENKSKGEHRKRQIFNKAILPIVGIFVVLMMLFFLTYPESTRYESLLSTPTIEEQILVDQDGLTITAENIQLGNENLELVLYLENETEKDLDVFAEMVAINGCMIVPSFNRTIHSGETRTVSMEFMQEDLDLYNITELAVIELSFSVFPAGENTREFTTEKKTIKTSALGTYEQTYDNSGTIVYEDNGIKISILGYTDDHEEFTEGCLLYIENNTDKDLWLDNTYRTYVNDEIIDDCSYIQVFARDKSIDEIFFYYSDLDENDITEINTVETSFSVVDRNYLIDEGYISVLFETDPIIMDFN